MSHQPNHFYEFGRFRLKVAGRLPLRGRESVPPIGLTYGQERVLLFLSLEPIRSSCG